MPTGWPNAVANLPVSDTAGPAANGEDIVFPNINIDDEQFLLRAFHSFAAAADSLERSYGSLRAEVARLRSELEEAQSRLRQEQALAEISAVLAHEIRNPLGSMELFIGLLVEAELTPECHDWVERVQAGLRTLAATVNNVLHFHSLPESECIPVDLGQLLDWARTFFAPLARRSRVVLSFENHLAGVRLSVDRHRLEQVILNLMLNALRAMPGGGWIELSGRMIYEGQAILFTVTDTGPGISPEHLPRIFEAGFSTRAGSPGLGLAVCRKIVEQHGGKIEVESQPGRGAKFIMTFPATSDRAKEPAA
jgi:two-component system, sensor histidine kinase FlrB